MQYESNPVKKCVRVSWLFIQTKKKTMKAERLVCSKVNFILIACVLQLSVAVASAPTYKLLKSSREQRTQFKRRRPQMSTSEVV